MNTPFISPTWRKTVPWTADEFIVVDGMLCVYSVGDLGHIARVHLHGGTTIPFTEALDTHRVIAPMRTRPAAYFA